MEHPTLGPWMMTGATPLTWETSTDGHGQGQGQGTSACRSRLAALAHPTTGYDCLPSPGRNSRESLPTLCWTNNGQLQLASGNLLHNY